MWRDCHLVPPETNKPIIPRDSTVCRKDLQTFPRKEAVAQRGKEKARPVTESRALSVFTYHYVTPTPSEIFRREHRASQDSATGPQVTGPTSPDPELKPRSAWSGTPLSRPLVCDVQSWCVLCGRLGERQGQGGVNDPSVAQGFWGPSRTPVMSRTCETAT